MAAEKETAQGKGFDVFDKADDVSVFVRKNNVDGKLHKKHVDLRALGNDQSFADRQRLPSQKSAGARKKSIC